MSDDQHLKKNEYDYWLCPLCNHALLYDHDPDYLHCPKQVDVFKSSPGSGIRWNHFDIGISSDLHPGYQRYTAVIPPFYIQWYKENQTVYAFRFGDPNDDWRRFHKIQETTCSEEELFKLYERYNKLKVFA